MQKTAIIWLFIKGERVTALLKNNFEKLAFNPIFSEGIYSAA